MTVSIPVSTCPFCGAVANPRWTECLACASPLSGPAQSTPSQRPGTAPAAAPTPSFDRNTLPEAWTSAAARFQQMKCPMTVSEERWRQVLADTDRLLEDLGEGWSWAKELAALDWAVEDIFGRDDADHQSLTWKVKGRRIGPVTSIAVTLHGADGSTTWVYRRVET